MARVALAWELGASFGHIGKLLALGRRLQARGHEPVYLVRDLAGLASSTSAMVLQAPIWTKETRGFPEPPMSYSEILLRFGYHDQASLAGLVDGWRSAFSLMQADVVVAEHAPTALLAARTLHLPAAVLGDGFTVPPAGVPMPNMRPWLSLPADRLASSDQRVLNSTNGVLRHHGVAPLGAVADLLSVAQRFLCTFAELDHYAGRSGEPYLGPQFEVGQGVEAVWPAGDGPRVFVYLQPGHRDFSRLLELLAAMGIRAVVHAPGVSEPVRKAYEGSTLTISLEKIRLDTLKDCALAITYAASGTTAAMLMAGIPMLMLPTHLEQFLVASRIQTLGAGIAVNPDNPPPNYLPLLRDALENPAYAEAARRFAAKYADFNQNYLLDQMTDRIILLATGVAA